MVTAIVLDKLAAGETVDNYKETGNSMLPIIKSRQPVTLAPVDADKVEPGDIVLAKVKGRYYTHLVHGVRHDAVLIGNNRGHINGWATKNKVFAIVTHVDGVVRKSALEKVK